MIWFDAANVTIFHSSISINDSEQPCFGVSHNLIKKYIHVDKHHLGSSSDINRVVGNEVLRCESAMDLTGLLIAHMLLRFIFYTSETWNTRILWALKGNAFPMMHPHWKMIGYGVDAITEIIDFVIITFQFSLQHMV